MLSCSYVLYIVVRLLCILGWYGAFCMGLYMHFVWGCTCISYGIVHAFRMGLYMHSYGVVGAFRMGLNMHFVWDCTCISYGVVSVSCKSLYVHFVEA